MKKDAYYFSHDSNARHDPKLGAVISKYGWAGYGLYWAVIECLRDQPDYSYPIGLLYGLPLAIGFDANDPYHEHVKFNEFIDFLVAVDLLKNDGTRLYSHSLLNRMQALTEHRERLSLSGKIGAERRWGGHRVANATPIAVKESKVKESKEVKMGQLTTVIKNKIPPDLGAVKDLFKNDIMASDFFDYYQSNGWRVGKNPMKDWVASARRWARMNHSKPTQDKHYTKNQTHVATAIEKMENRHEVRHIQKADTDSILRIPQQEN